MQRGRRDRLSKCPLLRHGGDSKKATFQNKGLARVVCSLLPFPLQLQYLD